MSSKSNWMLNRVWVCSALPVSPVKVVSFTLDQVTTLFGHLHICRCNTSKLLYNVFCTLAVSCRNKLCACWWISETDVSLVRAAKWVMSRWRMLLIHYSWGGWAECKWQWQTETLLLKCINHSRVLDLIFQDWDINWYTGQTTIISWKTVIAFIGALRKPQIWGGWSPDLTLHERGWSWKLFLFRLH